jgi:hypothetical protein
MKNLLPLAILFVIFLFYFFFRGLRRYKMLTKGKSYHSSMPGNWEKIIVDSEQCKVLFREYYEEEEIDESPTIRKLLDSIQAKNTAKKSGLSVVVYTHKFPNGEEYTFKSEPIKADDVTVRYMLMNLKTLSLFVDPLNRNSYLFRI